MKSLHLILLLVFILITTIGKANEHSVVQNKVSIYFQKVEILVDSSIFVKQGVERKVMLDLNFIKNSLDNSIPQEYVVFKEKYGIGLINEGCLIGVFSISDIAKNNQKVAAYLNEKYGKEWIKELSEKPFGL